MRHDPVLWLPGPKPVYLPQYAHGYLYTQTYSFTECLKISQGRITVINNLQMA